MRRRLWDFTRKHRTKGLCYLVGGAVISILVAWSPMVTDSQAKSAEFVGTTEAGGLHLLVQGGHYRYVEMYSFTPYQTQAEAEQSMSGLREMADRRNEQLTVETSIPGWAVSTLRDQAQTMVPRGPKTGSHLSVNGCGWPFSCVKWGIMYTRGKPGLTPIGFIRFSESNGLPYSLIWPGLLADALLYSPVPFALHWLWRAWIRHLRRSNGECPECGYQRRGLAGDAKCPECGKPPRSPP